VRFAFLSSAGPREPREASGSFHYAQHLETNAEAQVEVVAAIELRGLGVFRDAPGSQRFPEAIPAKDDRANFIAMVSQPESAVVAEVARGGFERHSSIPLAHWVLLRDDEFLENSASLDFIEGSFPTLLITDTQALRFGEFGKPGDVGGELDRERMARVIAALEPMLIALSGPRGDEPAPSLDGLTPSQP
jgi:hypothetical protein